MGQLLQLNEAQLEGMIREELRQRLNHLEHRHTFWDLPELERQTCMSRSFILDQFFYDDRFKKIRFKIGAKWYMPAKETEEFLLTWLRERQER
ncbi:hypothetical protein [Planococcus halocryophilus]|uniref:Group-specific protein n=1 Tax=Planococcus halocryophilus TaxID=1215089 RepID=A0A1C7DQ22_9BACL|nr:hypothetical protein [Planococcus halocryophilus]ANU13494.1 hypothetical protein BBI08_06410 [Planococcus halocryophilus]